MDNIFSFLFRFPSADGHHQRPFDDHTVPFEDDDDHGGNFFGFHAFPFNHDDMFRQLDESINRMMKSFGPFHDHAPDQEQGDFHYMPALPSPPEHDAPLRDKMLKQPDSSERFTPRHDHFFDRFPRYGNPDRSGESLKDSDLDDTVRSVGLGKIFENREQQLTPAEPKISRFFRSVTVRTHRDADGRVEEKRTVVDDKGEQTTVTRTVDGQTLRQTTIQKKNGDKETVEDMINMDENEKQKFEQKWQSPRASDPTQILPRNDDSVHNPGDMSIFHRLFGVFLYPGSRRD